MYTNKLYILPTKYTLIQSDYQRFILIPSWTPSMSGIEWEALLAAVYVKVQYFFFLFCFLLHLHLVLQVK